MAWLPRMFRAAVLPPAEVRADAENPAIPVSAANFMQLFGLESGSATGEVVTIETAMKVPAVQAAVGFISGTMAGLPLKLYKRGKNNSRESVSDELATLLHDAPNPDQSSFEWRKYTFEQLLTGGRGCSFIERNGMGKVVGIWPLDPAQTSVHREGARKFFKYRENKRTVIYEAAEVIDLAFMLKSDGLKHRSPIMDAADTIGLARAMTHYGSRFFNNGGVPPFAIEGNFQSGAAMQRAASDLEEAVLKAKRENRLALVLPMGLKIVPIGTDAQKSQMIEAQRFIIEEIARRYSLPPVFLQDLTKGTFSNNEQQDLHLTKHTIKRYAEQFEQECNLKLFGWKKRDRFVELNLDGLLRGDFKTRMEGYASAIQSGQMTPGETRDMENRPRLPGDDKLYMQGAMMPLDKLGLADPTGGNTNGS